MPTNALAEILPSRDCSQTEKLARKWAVTFAELYGVSLEDRGPRFVGLWVSALADLEPGILDAACRRAMQTCKFFPTPAEVCAHIGKAEEAATEVAAEIEWERVLDLRRRYWNPDMLGGFSRGMPKLSARVQQAARAAGVFRDFDSLEALHTWAKKRFVESFIAYGELEQDKFLLSDGEIKALLAAVAEQKKLPGPRSRERAAPADDDRITAECFDEARQRLGEILKPSGAPKTEPGKLLRAPHVPPPECFAGTPAGQLFREYGRALDAGETSLTWSEYKAQHFGGVPVPAKNPGAEAVATR